METIQEQLSKVREFENEVYENNGNIIKEMMSDLTADIDQLEKCFKEDKNGNMVLLEGRDNQIVKKLSSFQAQLDSVEDFLIRREEMYQGQYIKFPGIDTKLWQAFDELRSRLDKVYTFARK